MPSTRRDALAALGGGLALLAGCSGSESSTSRSVPGDRGDPVDYEYEKVRTPGDTPAFQRASQAERRTESDRATTRPPTQPSEFVASADDLADLAFADDGAPLREFAAATDFERAAVFLTGSRMNECFDQHLREGRMERGDHPHFAFCRAQRPADVECSADSQVVVAFAIRLPLPGGSSGYGASSGRCDRPERPPAFDPTTTEDRE